jgi:hypothetical protein
MLGPKECTYPLHRLAWRLIILPRPLLVFDRPPQPFDNDVVERPSPTSQAQLHPRCGQTSRQVETGQRGPLSTVAHVRSSPPQGLRQRLQAQAHGQRAGHRPREDIPPELLQHCPQGDTPTVQPKIGEGRTPAVGHPRDGPPTPPVRGHALRRMRRTQPWGGIERLHPQRGQPARHPFVMHRVPLTPSPGGHPPHASLRRSSGWRVESLPQTAMLGPLSLGEIIHPGAGSSHECTRPGAPQVRMRRRDQAAFGLRRQVQRFFLPASATVSCPMCWSHGA